MYHDRLFPTSVFLKDDFFDNYKKIEDLVRSDYQENTPYWQSTPDLYRKKPYEDFTKSVLLMNSEVLNSMKWVYEGFKITSMWSNVLKPGETHNVHSHANNFLSGVYYPYAEKSHAGITFFDPRAQANVIKPLKVESNIDNSDVYEYESKTNRIIIFPSWLKHFVAVNNSNDSRISISWNIQLTGKINDSNLFQSAEF